MNPKIYLLNLCFFAYICCLLAIHPRDSQMKGSQTNPLNNVHCLSLFPCLLPHPTLSPSCPNCQPPLSHVEEWGWRVPFLVALVPGVIATAGRRCMPESQDFLDARAREFPATLGTPEIVPTASEGGSSESQSDTRKAPQVREVGSKLSQLIRHQWPALLSGIGVVVAVSVLQYGGLIWCSVLLQKKGTDSVTGMQNFVFSEKNNSNNKQQTTNNKQQQQQQNGWSFRRGSLNKVLIDSPDSKFSDHGPRPFSWPLASRHVFHPSFWCLLSHGLRMCKALLGQPFWDPQCWHCWACPCLWLWSPTLTVSGRTLLDWI